MSLNNTTMIKRFVIGELPAHPEVMEYLKVRGGYAKIFSRFLKAQQLEAINRTLKQDGATPMTWEEVKEFSDRRGVSLEKKIEQQVELNGLPEIILVVEYNTRTDCLEDVWYLPPLE